MKNVATIDAADIKPVSEPPTAKHHTIYLPDGRVGGTALVDPDLGDGGWALALFDRSTWLGRDEDDEPYVSEDKWFLVKFDGYRFTVHQTVATMLEN